MKFFPKNQTFLICFLLLSTFSFSQHDWVKATYYFEKNIGTGSLVTEAQLYVNPQYADFVWPDFKRTKPLTAEVFGLPKGKPITIIDQNRNKDTIRPGYRVFTNFQKNKLYETKNYLGTKYVITEDLYKINWEITGEYKKIDNFLVSKAKAKFRGRYYNAWFTTEIPVNVRAVETSRIAWFNRRSRRRS